MSTVETSEPIVFAPLGDAQLHISTTATAAATAEEADSGSFVVETISSGSSGDSILSGIVDEGLYFDDIVETARTYTAYALLAVAFAFAAYAAYRIQYVHRRNVSGGAAKTTTSTAVHRSALQRRRNDDK